MTKKKELTEDKYFGSINIGYTKVDIVISKTKSVTTELKKDGSIIIYLNAEENDWGTFLGDLIHEVMECKMLKTGHRFYRTDLPLNFEPISCVFIINHDEFQIMCQEIGTIIAEITPDLYKAFMSLQDKMK